MEKKILNKIDSMRRLMTKETGVTPSLSLDDAKDYLIEILDEIKKESKKVIVAGIQYGFLISKLIFGL